MLEITGVKPSKKTHGNVTLKGHTRIKLEHHERLDPPVDGRAIGALIVSHVDVEVEVEVSAKKLGWMAADALNNKLRQCVDGPIRLRITSSTEPIEDRRIGPGTASKIPPRSDRCTLDDQT